jgi:hypothetical protein
MDLSPQKQSVVRRFNESRQSRPVAVLFRSSIYGAIIHELKARLSRVESDKPADTKEEPTS